MKNYHSVYDQFNNNWFLCLISPDYFDVDKSLMQRIRMYTSQYKLLEDRNNWIQNIKRDMNQDNTLENWFPNPVTMSCLSNDEWRKVFHKLWLMVLNQKAGECINKFCDENHSSHKKRNW